MLIKHTQRTHTYAREHTYKHPHPQTRRWFELTHTVTWTRSPTNPSFSVCTLVAIHPARAASTCPLPSRATRAQRVEHRAAREVSCRRRGATATQTLANRRAVTLWSVSCCASVMIPALLLLTMVMTTIARTWYFLGLILALSLSCAASPTSQSRPSPARASAMQQGCSPKAKEKEGEMWTTTAAMTSKRRRRRRPEGRRRRELCHRRWPWRLRWPKRSPGTGDPRLRGRYPTTTGIAAAH